MTVVRRRAIDHVRREITRRSALAEVAQLSASREAAAADLDDLVDAPIEDSLLRLVFVCCHPVLGPDARVALTLRLLGGLTTHEIARAFLVADATIGQRVSRAKRTLSESGVPFEVPDAAQRADRLASVLEVVYLIFNEGYAATAGDDWMRPALLEEALRLGRMLATLAPDEAEVHGLVALMEIQASRQRARTDADGNPVLLLAQDRRRWDRLLIRRGLEALERAQRLGGGVFTLQAAIAACHARAMTPEETDWEGMARLYAELAAVAPSPVVEVNRAVAVSHAYGAEAGLRVLEPLCADARLASYHLLPSVRGELLATAGRYEEARAELERAASLTENASDRAVLAAKIRDLPA